MGPEAPPVESHLPADDARPGPGRKLGQCAARDSSPGGKSHKPGAWKCRGAQALDLRVVVKRAPGIVRRVRVLRVQLAIEGELGSEACQLIHSVPDLVRDAPQVVQTRLFHR